MIRTFGIGPRPKRRFGAFGIGTFGRKCRLIQGKSVKNDASGKMTVFGPFWGPVDDHTVPKKESVFRSFSL